MANNNNVLGSLIYLDTACVNHDYTRLLTLNIMVTYRLRATGK